MTLHAKPPNKFKNKENIIKCGNMWENPWKSGKVWESSRIICWWLSTLAWCAQYPMCFGIPVTITPNIPICVSSVTFFVLESSVSFWSSPEVPKRHPQDLRRHLEASGIICCHVPSNRHLVTGTRLAGRLVQTPGVYVIWYWVPDTRNSEYQVPGIIPAWTH